MKKILLSMLPVIALFAIVSVTYDRGVDVGTPAFAACFRTDIQEKCCPMACQVEKDQNRDKANQMLQSCMATVLGCDTGTINGATVFSMCNCR